MPRPRISTRNVPSIPAPTRRSNDDGVRNTYATTTDGKKLIVAIRGRQGESCHLALDARGCVALAARLLAGAEGLFASNAVPYDGE